MSLYCQPSATTMATPRVYPLAQAPIEAHAFNYDRPHESRFYYYGCETGPLTQGVGSEIAVSLNSKVYRYSPRRGAIREIPRFVPPDSTKQFYQRDSKMNSSRPLIGPRTQTGSSRLLNIKMHTRRLGHPPPEPVGCSGSRLGVVEYQSCRYIRPLEPVFKQVCRC